MLLISPAMVLDVVERFRVAHDAAGSDCEFVYNLASTLVSNRNFVVVERRREEFLIYNVGCHMYTHIYKHTPHSRTKMTSHERIDGVRALLRRASLVFGNADEYRALAVSMKVAADDNSTTTTTMTTTGDDDVDDDASDLGAIARNLAPHW